MNKLALHFICKNESHVVERMLESGKSILDMIVAVDTGSDDGTQDIIRNFGEKNNIPTFVFDRPFDNFENSRNHSMQKAIEMAKELNWNLSKAWVLWYDCDETIIIDKSFNKELIDKDLYMINAYIGSMKYTRNTFARMSKSFQWLGPVHEFIIAKEENMTSGLLEGVHIDVKMEGHSWKGNIPDKYKKHAALLEDYIDNVDRNSRWLFYTAQSYHDSASLPDNRIENEERLRRALKYYKERVNRMDGYEEERFYSQVRIGSIMRMLEYPWTETSQELLRAFAMEPLRGESLKIMIEHYLSVGEWNLAYLYTKFCKANFHGKNPFPHKLLFVDEPLYNWKLLEMHAASSFYTGRKDEAIANYDELLKLTSKNPHWFTQDDIQKINFNAQYFK